LQICHATVAVRDASAVVRASARSSVLLDGTQTNIDLRTRRIQKLSALVAAFQQFVDALRGHVFEAVHVGARSALFSALRDSNGAILPHDIGALQIIVKEFCVRAHGACFLRSIDSALKSMVDEGLQLSLDLRSLLGSQNSETLLTNGGVFANAQQIHAKFHALMTQLCFRVRLTKSSAAAGFIERLDFNSYYLSALVDTGDEM